MNLWSCEKSMKCGHLALMAVLVANCALFSFSIKIGFCLLVTIDILELHEENQILVAFVLRLLLTSRKVPNGFNFVYDLGLGIKPPGYYLYCLDCCLSSIWSLDKSLKCILCCVLLLIYLHWTGSFQNPHKRKIVHNRNVFSFKSMLNKAHSFGQR